MSNRIINTIIIPCVFLGSSNVIANQKPITVENIAKEYQSYIVDYKGYPSARRSTSTEQLIVATEEGEVSSPKKVETTTETNQ